jgi:ATP/ADP translocase
MEGMRYIILPLLGTLVVSILGIVEYIVYTDEQKRKAPNLSKMFLFGMSLVGIIGGLGLVLFATTNSFSAAWGGFSVLFLLVAFLVFIQYRMHQKMEIEKSPLRKRFTHLIKNESNGDEQSSKSVDENSSNSKDVETDTIEENADHSKTR